MLSAPNFSISLAFDLFPYMAHFIFACRGRTFHLVYQPLYTAIHEFLLACAGHTAYCKQLRLLGYDAWPRSNAGSER